MTDLLHRQLVFGYRSPPKPKLKFGDLERQQEKTVIEGYKNKTNPDSPDKQKKKKKKKYNWKKGIFGPIIKLF